MRLQPRALTAATIAALAGAAQARPDGAPFPAVIPLSTLDGARGFTLNGAAVNDFSGFSVAPAGDVNDDGVDDLLIGARSADPGGLSSAGSTYVVFGRSTATAGPFPASIGLSTLTGHDGFRLDGAAANDISGRSVAPAGDINGDGVDDLLIGARDADPGGRTNAGSTYVVFGRNTATAGAFPASIGLSTLTGANGFRLDGAVANDRSGHSVAPAGDVNGDGVDDLLIGAYAADPGGLSHAGATYVVFGRNTATAGAFPASIGLSTLNGANGFRLDGAAGDLSGHSVAPAGDVNGDGVDDLLIGAYAADPGGISAAGSTYVVFGRNTATAGPFPASVGLSTLTGADGFRLDGAAAADRSGVSVAPAGDVNGDGVEDLLIGAFRADQGGLSYAGATYVVFGRNTATAGPFPASIGLSTLTGADGFRLDGAAAFDYSGASVAPAGDVNGDGVDDLLIGASYADPGGLNHAGSTYVVFGRNTATAGPFPASIGLSTLTGADGFRLDGAAVSDRSGRSIAPAGDVNDDGVDDLLIGAPGADPGEITGAGATYLVFGRAAPCEGDTNGDNVVDFVDLNNVLSAFGAALGQPAYIAGADLNDDNVVDFLDLNIVLSFFGTAC